MENKPSTPSEFEKLLKRHLEQLESAPDDNTWAHIAAQQRPANRLLRVKYMTKIVLPIAAAGLLTLAGWWHLQHRDEHGANPPAAPEPKISPYQPGAAGNPPVAVSRPGTDPGGSGQESGDLSSEAGGQHAQPSGKPYPGRQFGQRLNTVPAASLRFQAETGVRYQSPVSGTSVYIPANSLIDAHGQPVTGEVELLFREYRSIPDFLASGIPMHYGDERGAFFFNSGGMFEVRVHQYGEDLRMAPGREYDLNFAPTAQLTDARLYYYNESDRSWRYQPDAAFAQMDGSLPPVVTEAEVVRNNRTGKANECLPDLPLLPTKADPAVWMKDAVLTGLRLAEGQLKVPVWFQRNSSLTKEQVLNGLERGLSRIVRHRDQMEFFFPEDVNNVFTELKAFKDCYFYRAADSLNNLTNSVVIKSKNGFPFDPNEYWQRISIYEEAGMCHFWLYGEQGMSEFYAKLSGSTGNKNFDAEKVLAEYQRLREERQKNFDDLVNSLQRFIQLAPAFQTPEEWCMTPESWLTYFEKNRPLMQKRYAALVKAGLSTDNSVALAAWNAWRNRLRDLHFDRYEQANTVKKSKNGLEFALKFTNFGLYNCDQIYRLGTDRAPDYIYSAYKTPDGRRVVPASVSIMERNSRMFFTLPSAESLPRLPGRSLDIVLTDAGGRCYHLPAADYARLDLTTNQRSNTFTVEDVTEKTRTPREWAELLEM